MSDLKALIAEGHKATTGKYRSFGNPDLIARLTVALESTVAEMHSRELHHFETEQAHAASVAEVRQIAEGLRKAYPEDVFPELDSTDHQRIHEALAPLGITYDRVGASLMRHTANVLDNLTRDEE